MLELTELNLFQNIVKNLERGEVRDWLNNTKQLLAEEKKVKLNSKNKSNKSLFLFRSVLREKRSFCNKTEYLDLAVSFNTTFYK